MGSVSVQTDGGLMRFQIEGDSPTAIEKSKIQRIVMGARPERQSVASKKGFDVGFDTKTGIKDAGLH